MSGARACVLVFPGSNGDRDLVEALARTGFAARLHAATEPLPRDVSLCALPGGFSYGDCWRAGMLASQARAVFDLEALVSRGGLVLGICNGFQILVEAGLLPGALRANAPAGFVHRWVEVEVGAARSPWLAGLEAGSCLRLPIAHGEGNYFFGDEPATHAAQVAMRYRGTAPNGAQGRVAAMVDPSGQILGMMPHPERATERMLGGDDGAKVLAAAASALGFRGAA